MKLFQCWEIPIRLKSEANIREHWTAKHKRIKEYKKRIEAALLCDKIDIELPIQLTLIRIAPRALDLDNLLFAFKPIRDFICDKLIPGLKPGRADSSHLIDIRYAQETRKPKEYLIKIVMEHRNLLKEPRKNYLSEIGFEQSLSDFLSDPFI